VRRINDSGHPIQTSAPGRVGQGVNLSYPLPQIIERHLAVFEQRAAIEGWFNAARAAIQKAHPNAGLQIGNRLRHNRLRNPELGGRFDHAARLNDGGQYVQIPQANPPANAALPVDSFWP